MTSSLMLVAALAVIPAEPPRGWELLPHPTAYRMANVARAVVEGTVGDGGVVTVTRRYYVCAGDAIGETITVPALAALSRDVVEGLVGVGAPLTADRVLLFLAANPRGDTWAPMHHHGDGARGVLWFDGDDVYGYEQCCNPGPYQLRAWRACVDGERVAVDADEVRAVVARGVVARIAWRDALRVKDRDKRAAEVAKWFSPATSPDGARWRERVWPDLMNACDDLGAAIVAPLAQIVKADRDPAAAEAAADAVARIGGEARAATPALIARLRAPAGAAPLRLVRALHRLADPRAEAVLRDLVPHRDPFVAAEAARALHASGGADAADLLAARVPRAGDASHTVAALAVLLEALHDLDAARAERLVRERFLDLDELMQQRAWLRRLR